MLQGFFVTMNYRHVVYHLQNQSQMRNGMAFSSKKIPHLGHLSGCFQRRMRCKGETGQAGLNFSHRRAPRGGSRFNTAANFGAGCGRIFPETAATL